MKQTFVAILLFLATPLLGAGMDLDHPEKMNFEEGTSAHWAYFLEGVLDPIKFYANSSLKTNKRLSLIQKIQINEIKSTLENRAIKTVRLGKLTEEEALYLASEKNLYKKTRFVFSGEGKRKYHRALRKLKSANRKRAKSRREIEDLVFHSADLARYQDGKYREGIKLFLFCRFNRDYPCRFVMKDRFDRLVRDRDGSVWTMPALAKSASNLPFNITNGQTPQGAHSIDSVMPRANRQSAYGKFRRMILNWIPTDDLTKKLLPSSALDKSWWLQASIARDVGRKWLRIHGTGRTNRNPQSSFYPHSPTNGCISTREGAYPESVYIDQRILLDKAMEAMRMEPLYENEVKIKGVLFVIDLDGKKERVTKATLKEFGVF